MFRMTCQVILIQILTVFLSPEFLPMLEREVSFIEGLCCGIVYHHKFLRLLLCHHLEIRILSLLDFVSVLVCFLYLFLFVHCNCVVIIL